MHNGLESMASWLLRDYLITEESQDSYLRKPKKRNEKRGERYRFYWGAPALNSCEVSSLDAFASITYVKYLRGVRGLITGRG